MPEIKQDEVIKGISKMVHDIKVQEKISQQLSTYKATDDLFGLPIIQIQET